MHTKELYTVVYQIGIKIPKRDKLGIHQKIEVLTLNVLENLIEAALLSKSEKGIKIQDARRKIEVLKHLFRTEYEMKIIAEKHYERCGRLLENISMMGASWLKSTTQNPAASGV